MVEREEENRPSRKVHGAPPPDAREVTTKRIALANDEYLVEVFAWPERNLSEHDPLQWGWSARRMNEGQPERHERGLADSAPTPEAATEAAMSAASKLENQRTYGSITFGRVRLALADRRGFYEGWSATFPGLGWEIVLDPPDDLGGRWGWWVFGDGNRESGNVVADGSSPSIHSAAANARMAMAEALRLRQAGIERLCVMLEEGADSVLDEDELPKRGGR